MFCLALSLQITPPIPITEGLAIGGVAAGGRRPVPDDAIVREIVAGSWKAPHAGETVVFRGRTRTWHAVRAGKDGSFVDPGTYLFATVSAPQDEVMLLESQGDSVAYVNGEPRAGDPYGTGNLRLPVFLHQGTNEFLFVGGRGNVKANLMPMTKRLQLQSQDATLPDVLTTDRGFLWASVIGINGTSATVSGLSVKAVLPDGSSEFCREGSIPALSARKLMVKIPVPATPQTGKLTLKLQLCQGRLQLDDTTVDLTVKGPLEKHKRTFVSDIDGSVQYYSVVPAAKPSPGNALVFTVHGAGVEAPSQTGAYAQKDWCTIVAPTNRRPYGFDWEDIGVEDYLEVERIAKLTYPHDPDRVDLTGHSMGGHGTWFIGTLFPDHFASIAPSSGWVSFWSYAGGWIPESGSATEQIVRRSMDVSDVLGRAANTLSEQVYVLHGDADDNVPVQQARMMKSELEKIHHPAFSYHEQPGAGHWWGDQCVDWPPIFQMIQGAKLEPYIRSIDFTTQDLNVSNRDHWVQVDDQMRRLEPSHVEAEWAGADVSLKTTNVRALSVSMPKQLKPNALTIDGQRVGTADQQHFVKTNGQWGPGKSPIEAPWPGRFKNVFANRFEFVIGTKGSPEENAWAANRARYDAETMLYRGNGAVDIVRDVDFRPHDRNVILYGNADTNSAWKLLLGGGSVQVHEGYAIAQRRFDSPTIGGLVLYKFRKSLVGAVTGTGIVGMRDTDRLGLFTSGVAYPDWILLDPSRPDGILADGFYGDDWKTDPANSADAR